MAELTTDLTRRLAKLIPHLASDHEGEVLATVAAITRTLKAGGRDLHDLAAHVREARREAHTDHTVQYQPEDDRRPARGRYPSPNEAHLRMVKRCRLHGRALMTEWEATFVDSLAQQVLDGRGLSAKQVAVLTEITNRVGEAL